jgi:hypothetical protein
MLPESISGKRQSTHVSVDLQCAVLPVPMEAPALDPTHVTVMMGTQGHSAKHLVSPVTCQTTSSQD